MMTDYLIFYHLFSKTTSKTDVAPWCYKWMGRIDLRVGWSMEHLMVQMLCKSLWAVNDYNYIMINTLKFWWDKILNFSWTSCFPREIRNDASQTFPGGKNWFLAVPEWTIMLIPRIHWIPTTKIYQSWENKEILTKAKCSSWKARNRE